MLKKIFFPMIILALLFSCNNAKNDNPFEQIDTPDYDDGASELQGDAIENIVENISSPIEIAALMKSLDVPFSKKYLAPTDYADNYNSSFKKALGLGVLGADLGYLNMYSKTGSSVEYLATIKRLADGIHVGHFFDFSTIKRLATNSESLDSLIYISVHSFNEMDSYLRENNKGKLSTLMVTGAWLEGLYLATQVAKDSPHQRMKESVGEQKTILNELLIILDVYKKDQNFQSLTEDFQAIKREFDEVTITIEVGEPEMVEQDGKLMIIQNEKSIVHITDEQLGKIIEVTEQIRNKLIKS